MITYRLPHLIVLIAITLLLVACGSPASIPEPTAIAPTATALMATPIPPTDTPLPPPPTSVPTPRPTPTSPPPTDVPEPTPVPEPVEWPMARGYVSMAYDIESDRFVVFGGQLGEWKVPGTINGETWIYDAGTNRWSQMKPASGPSPKVAACLVYDSESDRVIMFGGADSFDMDAPQNETWAYDTNTNTWTQMAAGPERLVGVRLAYDAGSDRVILFGGWRNLGNEMPTDTWAYDYNTDTWTEMKPENPPPGRNYHGMAYDVESDRVLVWGPNGSALNPADESVWAYDYDTNSWEKMPIVMPRPSLRPYIGFAYDAESDRTILYGGSPLGGSQTWAYDTNSNTWVQMEPSTELNKLSKHAMAYSDAADRIVVFGGQLEQTEYAYMVFTDEVWSYDYNDNTWIRVGP